MKTNKPILMAKEVIFLFMLLFAAICPAKENSIHAVASSDWSLTSTWNGGVVPTSSDDVLIDGGYSVTVDLTGQACNTLQLGSSTTGTLTFTGTSDLTVTGAITVSGEVSFAAAGTITMTSGATLT